MVRCMCPPLIWRGLGWLRHGPEPQPTPQELEVNRLRHMPGSTPTVVKNLFDRPFHTADAHLFLAIYHAFFGENTYKFVAKRVDPLIIDGGANEGITVRYWKSILPDARIIAFEPDPDCFRLLSENCVDLNNIELHSAGLWKESGTMSFKPVGGLGGHLSCCCPREDLVDIKVEMLRLRDFLVEPVDFLKLDIEGAEIEVLQDCADRLHLVDKMYLEYHSFIQREQKLATLFSVLEKAGFRIHAHTELPAVQPYLLRPVVNNKDLRLNVFCFR
jgi:FkbM family methyltransferase